MPYYIKKKKKPLFDKGEKRPRTPRRATVIKRLDTEFSRYIRLRDSLPNGTFRCISCGLVKPIAQADCGHFFSRTKMSVRFSEANCNAECRSCNRFSADHLIGYRTNLIRKIGTTRFKLLEVEASTTKKWDVFELERMAVYYRTLADALAREKGIAI